MTRGGLGGKKTNLDVGCSPFPLDENSYLNSGGVRRGLGSKSGGNKEGEELSKKKEFWGFGEEK